MDHSILVTQLDPLSFSSRDLLASGHWHLEFLLGLWAIVAYLVSRVEIYAPARALWCYCLCYAIFIVEFPGWVYGPENVAFQASAGANALEVGLIPLFALALPLRHLERLLGALKWVMLGELLCVWLDRRGLLVAPSFDCALVALYLPFAPRWLWALAVATILTHHAGAAQAMLAVYGMVWAWRNLPWKKSLPAVFVLAIAAAGIAYLHSHAPLLDAGERMNRWMGRFQYFWLYQDPTILDWREAWRSRHFFWPWVVFGVGPGTFTWFSLKIDHFGFPAVLFLHNEFLQIPWELGLLGLGFVICVWQKALRLAWKNPPVFYALAALIPFAFFWHPLRWFPAAALVALIFRMALKEESPRLSGAMGPTE